MSDRLKPRPLEVVLEHPGPYLVHLSMMVGRFMEHSGFKEDSQRQDIIRDSWRLIKAAKWWKDLDRQKYGFSNDLGAARAYGAVREVYFNPLEMNRFVDHAAGYLSYQRGLTEHPPSVEAETFTLEGFQRIWRYYSNNRENNFHRRIA